jgi:hypothetical protein
MKRAMFCFGLPVLIMLGCASAPVQNDELKIDFNQPYLEYNAYYSKQKGAAGYSGDNGQPSLIWRAELDFSKTMDEHVSPEIIGHGSILGEDHQVDPDISKITTAQHTFSYMGIRYIDGH